VTAPLPAALFAVLVALAAATVAGAILIRPWTAGLTKRERLAWGLAAGLLLQAACLLVLLAVHARPSAWKILLLEAVAVTAAWLAGGKRTAPAPTAVGERGSRILLAILASIAAAAWLVFLFGALADSMWATDFLAFWGYKGKVIFLTGEIPQRLFQDPALYFAHREYPLLVPFTFAALATFLGQWNDQAMALLDPICALATLLAISGFLARRASPLSGAVAAALAALCVFLYRPANAGTAEVPFALGLVLASSSAVDFLEREAASSLGRLALASLFCAALKQEGSLFVLLLAAALLLRTRRWRPVAALALPVAAHWVFLYLLRGNQTRRDFDFTLLTPARWPELSHRFGSVVGRILGTEGAQALVPILAIAVYFGVTRRGIADPLLPVFAAQLLFYAVAFTVSSFDPMYAIDGAVRRITMSLFPAFTLVLGARLPTVSAGAARIPRRPAPETARS